MNERAVKEYLMKTDQDFRELANKHQRFEQELERFSGKSFLTPDEQVQRTVIKKKKLVLKDKMQLLIHRYRVQQQAAS
jgi:uncharacterized protein YdcH (DUF465 family)